MNLTDFLVDLWTVLTITDEIWAVPVKIKHNQNELHNSQKCSVNVGIVVTKFSFVCRIRELLQSLSREIVV